ncbi:hypothetical protein [Mycoplasma leonicaptivi]|uniref:hypothetical protein n=1 Tax=Mycoplasma leonicaptivi TaxID=36742 RepID=UPI000AE95713|nr:hypothetical protein [Mycoplasma leonicaptivi]
MRTVKEFTNFKKYYSEMSENLRPFIKEKIEESISKQEIQDYNFSRKMFITFFSLSFVPLVLLFLTFLIISKNPTGAIVYFVIMLLLGIGLGITTYVFYRKYSKIRENFRTRLSAFLQENGTGIYDQCFKWLDNEIEYLGNIKDTSGHSYSPSMKEIRTFRSAKVPYDAYWYENCYSGLLKLRKKHLILFSVDTFRNERKDSKGNITYNYFTSGLIKIQVNNEITTQFPFELLNTGKRFFKKVKLENNEFVKTFKPGTDNELAIRQMYTPLSMELSLELLKTVNTKISNFGICSNGSSIFISFPIDPGFMRFDVPVFKSIEKATKELFNDILYDTFSFYYLIAFMLIPTYIE